MVGFSRFCLRLHAASLTLGACGCPSASLLDSYRAALTLVRVVLLMCLIPHYVVWVDGAPEDQPSSIICGMDICFQIDTSASMRRPRSVVVVIMYVLACIISYWVTKGIGKCNLKSELVDDRVCDKSSTALTCPPMNVGPKYSRSLKIQPRHPAAVSPIGARDMSKKIFITQV